MSKKGASDSREQFEAWYQGDMQWSRRFEREENSKGTYMFLGTEKAWQAWEAGRKALIESQKSD